MFRLAAVLSALVLCWCCANEQALTTLTSPDSLPAASSATTLTTTNSASIAGAVVDASGMCIANAIVEIVSGEGTGRRFAQVLPCDAWEIGFGFSNLTPGVSFTIRASAPGYDSKEKTIVPSAGPSTSVVFELSPTATTTG
jgi:hypothetical protein